MIMDTHFDVSLFRDHEADFALPTHFFPLHKLNMHETH